MHTESGLTALVNYILDSSEIKLNKRPRVMLGQGILAGIYIALGAIASLIVTANVADPGLGNFLGAFVFPLGVIAILVMQAELFTSDTMVIVSVYARRVRLGRVVKFLLLIFFANILGAVLIAFLTRTAGIFNEATTQLVASKALAKVRMPIGQLFSSAVLCNIIVCTGVCLAYNCKDEAAKIISVWLAITVFALSGTEHVVANMYYLFTALFLGAPLSAQDMIYNLTMSGIGNFIGGGIIVSGFNYLIAKKRLT